MDASVPLMDETIEKIRLCTRPDRCCKSGQQQQKQKKKKEQEKKKKMSKYRGRDVGVDDTDRDTEL